MSVLALAAVASPTYIEQLLYVGLGVVAALGLLALVLPKVFARIASTGGMWFDSAKMLAIFDRRWEIDGYVLKHPRMFGLLILSAAATLAFMYVSLR